MLADRQLAQTVEVKESRLRQNGNDDVCVAVTTCIEGIDGIDVAVVLKTTNIARCTGDDTSGFVFRENDCQSIRQCRTDSAGFGQATGVGEDGVDFTA